MRDAVIALIIVAVTLYALRQPWVGVMAWTLVSLMSPHVEFGYSAAGWPVAMAIAGSTLVGLAITKDRQNPLAGAPAWWLLIFTLWTCITLPFSYFVDWSYPLWVRSMKIYLMLFVTLALITDRRKLDVFIWMNVIAIGYYGVKGGLFTIATGGNYRVWGPGGFIEGNNEVALAAIATVPLMRYLQLQMTRRWARHAMTAAMALSVVMALGTYSRGALVGVACMGLFFWWKSGSRLVWGVMILLIGAVAASLMPEQWWERMDTIKTYDADQSAMGRINAWWMAFNLAKDNLFGGGFMVWTASLFQRYAPNPDAVHAAHSIYFQVLGEHGFIGLACFLAIGVSTWFTARRLAAAGRSEPRHRWAAELGAMVQVSMIGYATAGAFLSLAYFDLPYNVMVAAVLALKFVRQDQQPAAAVTPPPPQAASRARPRATRSSRP
jgi:putative inorganic carbon (hco3(-)) transporter